MAIDSAIDAMWQVEATVDAFVERPTLVHYTSIAVFESILRNTQLWMSNPLLMNDLQELRFCHLRAPIVIAGSAELKRALGIHAERFVRSYGAWCTHFENGDALNTYISCFSEFRQSESDGKLSMWRAYGADGRGVGIVFDLQSLEVTNASPLVLGKVKYMNERERENGIERIVLAMANAIANEVLNEVEVERLAHATFQRLLSYSLFTKHSGFQEEQEWRLVYLRARDTENRLAASMSYMLGRSGPAPVLKLDLVPTRGVMEGNFQLSKLIKKVVLGPSNAPDVAVVATERMLRDLLITQPPDRLENIEVRACGIPYRPVQ